MSAAPVPPPGFAAAQVGRAVLIAGVDRIEQARQAGLGDPEVWRRVLSGRAQGSGRGATARFELEGGPPLRLKQLRRGGLAGPLWRDRFVGSGRLLDNLRVPLEAIERGIATPAPALLLLLPGPPGLCRAWLAQEEISGGRDLRSRYLSDRPPSREELEATMDALRGMHDRGLEHPDLNLGNLVLCEAGGSAEVFVVDLDGARLHAGSLSFGKRQAALRRLERSLVKCRRDVAESSRRRFYELYARTDPEMARRLDRGRTLGRWWIRFHRLGWRR